MKKIKQNGFVLIMVIAAMSAVSIAMSLLARGSNMILLQSQAAYLEACEHNLAASGLAWAELNIKNENIKNFNEKIELNVADMNIRKAALSVVVERPINKQTKVQLSTSCSRGRQTFCHKKKYQIRL